MYIFFEIHDCCLNHLIHGMGVTKVISEMTYLHKPVNILGVCVCVK